MILITQTEAYLIKLRNLIEPEDALEKHGYIVRPLTDEELLLKRRCLGCGKAMSQVVPKRTTCPKRSIPTDGSDESPSAQTLNDDPTLPIKSAVDKNLTVSPRPHDPSRAESVRESAFRCKYHPGQVVQKHWTCCYQHVTAKPCGGSNAHIPRSYVAGELTELYQFHPTPRASYSGDDVRAAVALDCEMGTALSGDSELIRITLIDYFSRAVLVNNIVEPDVPMQHLNTRFSGVSWGDVRKAKREGNCLKGKAGARRALWRYVGQKTVVVGHGASNDLRALRWIHGLVVDSFVTEFNTMKRKEAKNADKKDIRTDNASEGEVRVADPIKGGSLPRKDRNGGTPAIHLSGKVPNGYGNETATNMQKKTKKGGSDLSLKNLVKKRLDRDIQMGGKVGHDSLEDAIAARDLIDWIITNANQE